MLLTYNRLPAAPGDRFHMTLSGIGTASIGFEA